MGRLKVVIGSRGGVSGKEQLLHESRLLAVGHVEHKSRLVELGLLEVDPSLTKSNEASAVSVQFTSFYLLCSIFQPFDFNPIQPPAPVLGSLD
jgi:hypothetical protein